MFGGHGGGDVGEGAGAPGVRREKLLHGIANQLDGLAYVEDVRPQYCAFRLAPAPTADYAFSVWVYDDGEPQLTAQLVNAQGDHRFWSKAFEAADWESVEDRDEVFLDTLDVVLNGRTRIRQVRGWLFWHFSCHVQADDEWKAVGGMSWGRWIKGIPPVPGRRQDYYSPRLVRAA
jgi:hypothetical protein